MKYLFFDIELASCIDGGKICEFGYVLTDEGFNEIQSENILIDPQCEFDPYVLRKILTFRKSDYLSAPTFDVFYHKIYSLLTDGDTLVIGHTTQGDAEHIGDECFRYKLKSPNFRFVDIVEIYKKEFDLAEPTSLTKMALSFDITVDNEHCALGDAVTTMAVTKKLCEKANVMAEEFLNMYPECEGELFEYEKTILKKRMLSRFYYAIKYGTVDGKLTDKDEKRIFSAFRKKMQIQKKQGVLTGKRVCVSEIYENTDFTFMINAVKAINEAGGTYVTAPTKCDVFVKFDRKYMNEELYCKRLEVVKRSKKKWLKILTKDEFKRLLNLTDEDLKAPVDDVRAQFDFSKDEEKPVFSC